MKIFFEYLASKRINVYVLKRVGLCSYEKYLKLFMNKNGHLFNKIIFNIYTTPETCTILVKIINVIHYLMKVCEEYIVPGAF